MPTPNELKSLIAKRREFLNDKKKHILTQAKRNTLTQVSRIDGELDALALFESWLNSEEKVKKGA